MRGGRSSTPLVFAEEIMAQLPRRIILSRKGWDSSSGGKPSPILPDGTLLTLPIPDRRSGVRFRELRSRDDQIDMGNLVENLTHRKMRGKSELHLDPDLRKNAIRRDVFQPAFGQSGTQQSHLENQGLNKSRANEDADLFLFFGLYRQVMRSKDWHYVRSTPELHVIFGWLQVDRILCLPEDEVPSNLKRHPHAIPSSIVEKELGRRSKGKRNNTIYLPRERLTFLEQAGSGLFEAPFSPEEDDPRRISAPGQRQPTNWRLPSFFHGMSNMGTKQPKPIGQFWEPQRNGRGQEFVLDVTCRSPEAQEWLARLFQKATAPRL
jgi:putative DNA base modification enzyme with NMAD domain